MPTLRWKSGETIDALQFDWLLTGAFLLLTCFGLAALYGLSLNAPEGTPNWFSRQLLFGGAALLVYFGVSLLSFRAWSSIWIWLYGGLFTLLAGAAALGSNVHGSAAWLRFGSFSFEPVELAKFALIVVLSWYLAHYGREFFLWRHLLATAAFTGVYVLAVLLQPDLGSALSLLAIWLGMLLSVGLPLRRWLLLGALVVVVAAASWLWLLVPYQRERVLVLLNPQRDPLGQGYNVRQAVIAVGAGQLTGRGLGLGSQSQLRFLPEQHTDFIFAALAEELGLVGAGTVLLLYAVLLARLLRLAARAGDNFGGFLCAGAFSLLLAQVAVNVGMNLGLLPVTGLPLPLISYGGSSLLSTALILGAANSVARGGVQPAAA